MSVLNRIVVVSSIAFSASAFAASPSDLPTPDAGLWELKTALSEMGGMAMTFESCVDGTFEEMMTHPEVENADCTDQTIDQQGNRIVVSATCTIEGSRAEMNGVFTGDFAKAYQGEIRSTYTPPLHGMASTTMKVDARWLSACRPGQKPGDARMVGMPSVPGVGNIDLEGLMRNLPQMPGR